MINVISSTLIVLIEFSFGFLAILTQRAALLSKNAQTEIVHGMAWSVEVFISVGAFFINAVFSTPVFAIISFIVGILIIGIGTTILYKIFS